MKFHPSQQNYYKSVDLDIGFRCALKCPKCSREADAPKDFQKYDMTLENFTKILDTFETITFCGSQSDPIYHPKLLDFLDQCNSSNKIQVKTNGYGKTEAWWNRAITISKRIGVQWVFGVDGLPKDSHKYRVNQDGEAVFEVMKKLRSHGVDVVWQYIIFKYNEDTIEEASQLAAQYDIPLRLRKSPIWDGPDDPYLPTNPNNYLTYGKNLDKKDYSPSCVSGELTPILTSYGFFLPCCRIERGEGFEHFVEAGFFDDQLNISNVSDIISDIFNSKVWLDFFSTVETDPCKLCETKCNKKNIMLADKKYMET